MNFKIKKLSKLLTISLLIGLIFNSCQVDDEVLPTSKTNQLPYTVSKIKFDQIKDNTLLLKNINEVKELQKQSLEKSSSSKIIYDPIYDFYINTNEGKLVESNYDNKHSYTFPIINLSTNDVTVIKNLVFSFDNITNNYKTYIISYKITPEEKIKIDNNQYVNLAGKSTIQPLKNYNAQTVLNSRLIYIDVTSGQVSCWDEIYGTSSATGWDGTIIGYSQVPCNFGSGGAGGTGTSGSGVNSNPNYNSNGSDSNGSSGSSTSTVGGGLNYGSVVTSPVVNPVLQHIKTFMQGLPVGYKTNQEIFQYLLENSFSFESQDFVSLFINNSNINPNLNIDFNLSTKSPAFIDMSSVNGNTAEEIKFREVYQSLTTSPDFKKLFINLFGVSPLFNVKFIITNIPTTSQGQPSGRCTLIPSPNNSNPYNVIEIDRNFILTMSKVDLAKTVLYECIHAFLNIKLRNPNIGMTIQNINNLDFQSCINTYYNGFYGNQTQHSFFVHNMIPIMVNVLNEIKDLIVTPEQENQLQNPIGLAILYSPMIGTTPLIRSTNQIPWNWNDFFYYFCHSGLQNCVAYPFMPDFLNIANYYNNYYTIAFNTVFNP